jgi:adenine-specific DNA methylase
LIERNFDIPFIADLAHREKQSQQNYRPVIAVHKWFARRPGTLFRGLLLAEFVDGPLSKAFYNANSLENIRIADPFMGGGTPLLEANRLGCDVIGFDINPMAYWIVRQEIEHLDLKAYDEAAESLHSSLESEIGQLYKTQCVFCGKTDRPVKYFLWVKVIQCRQCQNEIDLFPGYLIAANSRHPKNVFLCPACGQLNESSDRAEPGNCSHCGTRLSLKGPAGRNQCQCRHCQTVNYFPDSSRGPPRHRLFALEYHCPSCKKSHAGRFFKTPDRQDLEQVAEAEKRWAALRPRFVPNDQIPTGVETNRLHRWGYRFYREMFNARQLLGLELSARIVSNTIDERIRNAQVTNLSDLLRYQNMLCRYDTTALKSLDIFSVHGFPVGLIQCESNLLGIKDFNKSICIGSGGWANIINKFRRAKAYCDAPFEVRHRGRRKEIVPIRGEWIGDFRNGDTSGKQRMVDLQCRDSTEVRLPEASLDAVFTDPPYFSNVQYAELMDFCYVWMRRLIGEKDEAFKTESTRNRQELTGNEDMGRGLEHFTAGLSSVFQRMVVALKPGSPLTFTYHHNDLNAYLPIAVAILDAGLICSASLPCPAEMGASIHISGTRSSIIDTVFVCRTIGSVPAEWLPDSIQGVTGLVVRDVAKLRQGSVKPTPGDVKCIAYGQLIRLAIWNLRKNWNKNRPVTNKLSMVKDWITDFGGWEVEKILADARIFGSETFFFAMQEKKQAYAVEDAYISF